MCSIYNNSVDLIIFEMMTRFIKKELPDQRHDKIVWGTENTWTKKLLTVERQPEYLNWHWESKDIKYVLIKFLFSQQVYDHETSTNHAPTSPRQYEYLTQKSKFGNIMESKRLSQ